MTRSPGETVYERIAASRPAGDAIRPGGLALTRRALCLCSFSPGIRMLDLGCGSGATVEYLSNHHTFHAVGIDPSLSMLRMGTGKFPALPLVRARGEDLPFGDEQMDCILAECSLSVTTHPDVVLDECYRVLKPRGRLILSDIYARGEGGIPDTHFPSSSCCLAGAISREEWMERLERHGFRILLWEDHSKALKEFAAMLIFSHGSLQEVWRRFFPCGEREQDASQAQMAVSRSRPGYFLLIASRE